MNDEHPAQSAELMAARKRLRRRAARRRQRGVALVMVLGALTILTVLLTEFQDETSAEFGSALSARDSLKAEYAARSGINLSRLLIASEPMIRKALAPLFLLMRSAPPQIPVWEFADQVLGAFNDETGAEAFKSLAGVGIEEGENLGLEGAAFEVKVVDEDSKINLNTAWRDLLTQKRLSAEILGLISGPQFNALFEGRDADGNFSDRQTICGALIDWVDADQNLSDCDPLAATPTNPAAEDSYYQLLDPRYQRKNAPFDSLEELRLVRGVGDDFWATFIEPDHHDPTKRNVTVWGQGKVNVNTANAQTLLALICGGTNFQAKVCTDLEETAKFLSVVEMVRGFTMGAPIFTSPKGFVMSLKQTSQLGQMFKPFIEPIVFVSESEAMKAVTTDSKVFSIYATGAVKAGKRETRVDIHAVVDFRGAPKPPDASPQLLRRLGEQAGGAAAMALNQLAQNQPRGGQGSAGDDPLPEEALDATLRPDPAGRVIYYRVD